MSARRRRRRRAAAAAGIYYAARRALAQNELDEYAAGVAGTDVGRRYRRAAIQAEQGVPPWRRWLIRHRILRELHYWTRMREIRPERVRRG